MLRYPVLALLALASLILLAGPAAAAKAGPSLPKRIEKAAGKGKQRAVAVAYFHSGTGATYSRLADLRFHPASTMKVPVMMALFDAVDRGEMRLDEPIAIRNQFQSIVDGSAYQLDPAEDGDPDLYAAVGQTKPLEELIRRMIVRSSNLATNLLIDRIGALRVTDLMRQLGAENLRVLRGVEDQKAYDAGLNNVTTARDLQVILKFLLPNAQGGPWTPASRQRMIDILRAQEFKEKIPAGLPPGTPVAHKTGDITGIHHDAAIVFPPGEEPYVLVVLTGGINDEAEANRVIAEVSKLVWEGRRELPGK
ncbi:MAG TPA: serine hydrolase [Thermoanaerobaculia bacterium]|nr:serine hydrolase [Thermoanaerobaculia bacterium]